MVDVGRRENLDTNPREDDEVVGIGMSAPEDMEMFMT